MPTPELGRVLVVDDETELTAVLVEALTAQGYQATGCTGGPEALEAMQTQVFDVLLADLMMPEMDGIALLKAATAIDPNLVGVIMTGQGTVPTAVEAMKIGAFDYVLKPFRLEALRPVLARAMEIRRLRLENIQLRETVAIYGLSQVVAVSLDTRLIVEETADAAAQQMDADEVSLMLATPAGDKLQVAAVRGEDRAGLLGNRVPFGQGIAGWVARQGEPLILNGEVRDSRFAPLRPRPEIQSAISMPLLTAGRSVGVLNVNSLRRRRPFTPGQVKALSILTTAAAAALHSAALYEEAERLREYNAGVVETMGEGLTLEDEQGRITFANARLLSMLGYAADEVVGQPWHVLAPRRELTQMAAHFAQDSTERYESTLLAKDGREIPVLVSTTPFRPGGRNAGVVTTFADLTEREQAEEALRRSEQHFRSLIENASDLIAVLDPAGNVQYVSPSVERLLGYSQDEWLGRQAFDLVHPDDQAALRDRFAWSIQRPGFHHAAEFRLKYRDGSWRTLEGLMKTYADERGRPAGLMNLHDVTERREAEAAEREQRILAEALRDTAAALNSTLELDEVLHRILDNVGRVVPHESANIFLIEAGHVRIAGGHGHSERGMVAAALDLRFQVSDIANIRAMAETGQPLIISDVRAYPGWVAWPKTEWIRSFAGAPIRVKNEVIGFIDLQSDQPGFFTPAHADRLQAFADQAATALENARLLAETRQRLADLETINRVSTALRAAQTLDEILPALLDVTLRVIHASQGAIWLYDATSDELRAVASRGYSEAAAQPPTPIKPGEGIIGRVFATGQAFTAREFRPDPRLTESDRQWIAPAIGGTAVPIRAGQGALGVFFVAVPLPRELSAGEVQLLTTVSEIAGNAIQRATLYAQTVQQLERLTALQTIDTAISSSLDLRVTLSVLLDHVIQALRADAADVLLLNRHTQVLEFAAGRGLRARLDESFRLPLGQGYAGRAALERRLLSLPDLAAAPPEPSRESLFNRLGARAYYAAPLIAKGAVLGVLEVLHHTPQAPDTAWLDFLETLAGQAAIAIDSTQLFNDLQRSNLDLSLAYDATIEGWSRALDLRDKETEGHTQRVTDVVLQLARSFRLRDDELAHMRRGALLHDIGKMGVPDSVLLKPGPLTEDEWAIMRQHPVYARDMLAPIQYLHQALDIPYCHHEKWDGTGYPRGLKGEAIPLAARLFAVVDVWDALRSDRPYRPAWPEDKVREHIRSLAGTHFDPRAVEAFTRLEEIG